MADPNVKKGLYVVTDPMYRMVVRTAIDLGCVPKIGDPRSTQ